MDIKDLAEEAGLTPKRKAALHGGEYCSPCPFCQAGDDRFLIWPQRHNKNGEYQGGRFSCRVCSKFGDAITFLCDLQGLKYKEACARLSLPPKERQKGSVKKPTVFIPAVAEEPPTLWIEKAAAFVDWSHEKMMNTPAALAQMEARGFTVESIKRFKIGFNPGDGRGRDYLRGREDWGLPEEIKDDGKPRKLWLPIGFTVPTFAEDGRVQKVKIRRTAWKDGDKLPKYAEVSGSKACPSVFGDRRLPVALVLESELDGLLLQQDVGDRFFCVALGGSTKPLDADTHALLKKADKILFLPDFDKAGAVAWRKWQKLFPHIQRVLTPHEKAAGDYKLAGGDLRAWMEDVFKGL